MRTSRVAGEQVDEVVAWLTSGDARAAARSELGRRRLPVTDDAVDEVLAEASLRVLGRLDRRGALLGADGDGANVVGYCRTLVRFVASDLLRAARVRSLDALLDEGDGGAPAGVEPRDDPADVGVDGRAATDAVRLALHAAAADRPAWVVAAGCVVVTLATDGDAQVAATVPQPAVGDESRRARWAALHYAGRHDCLPDASGADDPGRRKRRERAVALVDDSLRQAADAAAGEAEP